MEKSIGGDFEPIVPTKALNLIAKLHMDADDDIDVKFSESQAVLRGPRATISTVLVEGRFPKYRDVLPTDLDKRVELKRDDFHSAVKRAALLTNEESRGIRLHVSGEGIVLSSRAPEQGEAMVKLHAEYSGEAMDIGFNPAFLMDALKVCDETVTLEMHSQTKPGVLKSGADFLYVVMPVNLS